MPIKAYEWRWSELNADDCRWMNKNAVWTKMNDEECISMNAVECIWMQIYAYYCILIQMNAAECW